MVANAYTNVMDAIVNLQMKGNKAALKAMIVKANEILASESAYTASSIEGLGAILANARAVYGNDDATQAMIDKAVEMLTKKVAAARLLGDVDGNGSLDTQDGSVLLRAAAELEELDADALESADVNGDGSVDTNDAALILQYSAEKISNF